MIETDRLILRPWRKDDILPFAEINRDEEVMEYFPKSLSLEETEQFYRRIVAEHDVYGYVFMRWRPKRMAALSATSDSIILILMRRFPPALKLAGGSRESIGIKVMPRKRQKPALIMRESVGYLMRFTPLRLSATIARSA